MPRTVYSESEIEEAFRFLSSGKHKGKVLIRIRDEKLDVLRSPARMISAIPKVYFSPKKSFIVTGGLGGVGLELADWLVRKGAKNLILNSRKGLTNGYQTLCLKKWRQMGINVEINKDNSTELKGAEKLIAVAESYGPVGGITVFYE